MKLSQVYELLKEKLKELCRTTAAKRVFFVIVVVVVICQAVFPFLYPTLKMEKLEQELHDAKYEIRKDINNSLRHFITKSINAAVDEIQQLKTEDRPIPNSEQELRQSFEDIRSHLNALILKVGNLSAVSTVNSSFDSKMSHLFWKLNTTKNKLVRLRTKLTKLNYSIHNDMMPFVAEAMNDLRQQLSIVRNSTTANVSELWKQLGRADAEIEDVVKLFAKQNQTFHFKMAYHSDVLYSELKDVERKQSRFHNNTTRVLNELRSDLNETRHGLHQSIDNQIADVNKTWHERLENAVGFLHSSVEKVDTKVDGINHKLEKRINVSISKQSEIKDDLSKVKANFQENDRKLNLTISGQASKIDKTQKRVASLENERKSDSEMIQDLKNKRNSDSKIIQDLTKKRKSDLQMIQDLKNKRSSDSEMIQDLTKKRKSDLQVLHDLKVRVEKMENGASGPLKTDLRLIFTLLVAVVVLIRL